MRHTRAVPPPFRHKVSRPSPRCMQDLRDKCEAEEDAEAFGLARLGSSVETAWVTGMVRGARVADEKRAQVFARWLCTRAHGQNVTLSIRPASRHHCYRSRPTLAGNLNYRCQSTPLKSRAGHDQGLAPAFLGRGRHLRNSNVFGVIQRRLHMGPTLRRTAQCEAGKAARAQGPARL
jgi:hypothetical protein